MNEISLKKQLWSTAEDLNPHSVGIWNFIFLSSELIRISLENINDNFLKSLFWLRIKIVIWSVLICRSWEIFEIFREPVFYNVIYRDDWYFWSNEKLKIKVKDRRLTLLTFWSLLSVKCSLENFSRRDLS